VNQRGAIHHGGDSLLDGCAQVYLDVGSNIGVQVRKLFEPHLYPGAKVLPIFDSRYGPPSRRSLPSSKSGLCAVGFEANPAHESRLKAVQESYVRQGWRVHFFVPMAVDTANGTATMWTNGLLHNSWGASVFKRKSIREGNATQKAVSIPKLDMAAWISKHVKGRSIPKNHTRPYVLAKFDIEGSEYPVLTQLANYQIVCANVIQEIFLEWHPFSDKDTVIATLRAMQQPNRCAPFAQTALLNVDDESYGNDGKPLP